MKFPKQTKINKLFRKAVPKVPEDCEEILEEIQQLQQILKEKQDALFQLQRNSYRHKVSRPKAKIETFVRPQTIILKNSVASLKRDMELMAMLTGMEVTSYEPNRHCCVVFHMQHDSRSGYPVKYGLRIEIVNGAKEVSLSSLPVGFNLNAVLTEFDNIMMPDCIKDIQRALMAYHDRLEQYEALKKLLNVEAQLFKVMDGTHIEISFMARSEMEEEDESIDVTIMLDYNVYDVRPKTISFKENDLPEDAADALKVQCSVFKKKPLRKAFKQAFITGVGPYTFTPQVGPRPKPHARRRPRPRPGPYNNNDDTFRPEDCSDNSDEDDNVSVD